MKKKMFFLRISRMPRAMAVCALFGMALMLFAALAGCGSSGDATDDDLLDDDLDGEPMPPANDAEALPDTVAAMVNGEDITVAEFSERLRAALQKLEQEAAPDEYAIRRLRETTLRDVIQRRLIAQQARQQQVSVSDEEFQAFLQHVRQEYDETDLQQILQEQGQSYAEWEMAQREDLLLKKLVDLNMQSMITVAPQEIAQYYERRKDKYDYPAQVRASQILTYEEQAAQAALQEIRSGKPFEEVAKAYSESEDAAQGGDLGFFASGVMPPEFDEVIFSLNLGQVSDVAHTPYGYQIFKLTDRRDAHRVSFEEAKPLIETFLKKQKRMFAIDLWMVELESKAKIVINQKMIMQVK